MGENTEVTTPTNFHERVKEKIKGMFVDLIPDNDWDELIKKTHDEFVKDEIRNLIRAEIREEYKNRVQALIKDPKWHIKTRWSNVHGDEADVNNSGDLIKIIIKEVAQDAINQLAGNAVANIMNGLQRY